MNREVCEHGVLIKDPCNDCLNPVDPPLSISSLREEIKRLKLEQSIDRDQIANDRIVIAAMEKVLRTFQQGVGSRIEHLTEENTRLKAVVNDLRRGEKCANCRHSNDKGEPSGGDHCVTCDLGDSNWSPKYEEEK